jgi:hypothetical protein
MAEQLNKKLVIEKRKLTDLIPAPYNPRQSTKKQEDNLKTSLEKFGVVEPVIVNKRTNHIVGGHFRVRELKKLNYKEIECVIVDLSLEDEKELNIRLNANTGEWDWDTAANNFDIEQLNEWGLEAWKSNNEIDLDSFFEDNGDSEKEQVFKIVLEYTEEDYNAITEAFKKHSGSKEQIILKLLGV